MDAWIIGQNNARGRFLLDIDEFRSTLWVAICVFGDQDILDVLDGDIGNVECV